MDAQTYWKWETNKINDLMLIKCLDGDFMFRNREEALAAWRRLKRIQAEKKPN